MSSLLLLALGCAQNSAGLTWSSGLLSLEAEALAGQRAAPAVEGRHGGVDDDPVATQRLTRIGTSLAPCATNGPKTWRFCLLASDKVNALALPGGLVYVTRGLYERIGRSDALLAAAIAHEMGHVIHKDGLKPRCGTVDEAIDRETRADRYGARLLVAAGYPSHAMAELLELTRDVHPAGWVDIRVQNLPSDAWASHRSGNLAETQSGG
ncbi:MAG: M48 family metallopeptidase [Phycisphaerae bacterium]|nr:M48 family metallopeptidase [Phycisphaerae bacterium]